MLFRMTQVVMHGLSALIPRTDCVLSFCEWKNNFNDNILMKERNDRLHVAPTQAIDEMFSKF